MRPDSGAGLSSPIMQNQVESYGFIVLFDFKAFVRMIRVQPLFNVKIVKFEVHFEIWQHNFIVLTRQATNGPKLEPCGTPTSVKFAHKGKQPEYK